MKLQVKSPRGTWHDVVRFDAGDDAASDAVMEHAEALGRLAWKQRDVFRVATDDPALASEDLLTWTCAEGWKAVSHAA